ncbi:MAG: hypothetical protein M1836_004139 [Candelina mexicana]|nr:MAG: hypothetical protein M1836_004139 [Candelina mexicana]
MQIVSLASVIVLSITASGLVVSPPSQDVINLAGGPPPTLPPPPSLSASASERLQLGLYLENLEADYFNSGLANISTWGLVGIPPNIVDGLGPIAAQEKIHVSTVASLLGYFNQPIPLPCKYTYPVSSTAEFLGLGSFIGSVGFGSVMDVGLNVSTTDPALVAVIEPTVATEARHNTFFRMLGGLLPSPSPADTLVPALFAKLWFDQFVVPGSCPNPLNTTYPYLPPLSVQDAPRPLLTTRPNGPLHFKWDASAVTKVPAYKYGAPAYIAWINQLNAPIYSAVKRSADSGKARISIPDGLTGVAYAVLVQDNTKKLPDDLVGVALSGIWPVQVT